MSQVLSTLFALGSVAGSKGVSGPMIGTKYAEENKRQFDESTQRAGRNVIGLQVCHFVLRWQVEKRENAE